MNMELLKRVRDAIADPDNETALRMGDWFTQPPVDGRRTVVSCELAAAQYGECGTTACIAGHTVGQAHLMGLECDAYSIQDQARKFLNLTEEESDFLFYAIWHHSASLNSWGERSTNLTIVTREDVVEYLDKCLADGELS